MTKIPDQPQDIFHPLTQDYLQAFDSDLISIMLYGSAAGGSYVKGKSDINILIVLKPEGMDRLDNALKLVKIWRKRNVAVPLVMTKAFIESSLDAYPIEFLNMKSNSELIYGENVLEALTFQAQDLRLQIERELKAKVLLLREGYLESEGAARPVRNLISKSLTAFISIFNALIYLRTGAVQHKREDTIRAMSDIFHLDGNIFTSCFTVRAGTDKLSSAELISLFKKYVNEVETICIAVDRL